MDLINTTPAGKVVQSTIELSSLLAQRVTITFDDFTAREAKALQILAEERESARKDRAFFDGEGSATPGSARIGSIPLEDL